MFVSLLCSSYYHLFIKKRLRDPDRAPLGQFVMFRLVFALVQMVYQICTLIMYSFIRSKDRLYDPKFSKWGGLN